MRLLVGCGKSQMAIARLRVTGVTGGAAYFLPVWH